MTTKSLTLIVNATAATGDRRRESSNREDFRFLEVGISRRQRKKSRVLKLVFSGDPPLYLNPEVKVPGRKRTVVPDLDNLAREEPICTAIARQLVVETR